MSTRDSIVFNTNEAGGEFESVADLLAIRPRQGIAAVQVEDRSGAVRVEPVFVIDFYREGDLP
ncbi:MULTISPECIES: hypothetical protein [unclassified Variovorax]|uniref:hypothetical protein n=1 Tax=unclassified Variovorax TaxID=663243 RepID=UPI003F467FBC